MTAPLFQYVATFDNGRTLVVWARDIDQARTFASAHVNHKATVTKVEPYRS